MAQADRSRRADRGTRIELDFLEQVFRRCPEHIPTLKALGDLYTHVGRFEEGLQIDLKLAEFCPKDPDVFYNLACSLALLNRTDESLSSLGKAIELGYNNVDWMEKDKDLESVWEETLFEQLCAQLRAKEKGS